MSADRMTEPAFTTDLERELYNVAGEAASWITFVINGIRKGTLPNPIVMDFSKDSPTLEPQSLKEILTDVGLKVQRVRAKATPQPSEGDSDDG